jgi:hypothetical protein
MGDKDRKEAPKLRHVSNAPAPATSLGGRGVSRPSSPELMQKPYDFPLFYPNELESRTAVIRTKAVRKFPEQRQISELCEYFIVEMTPLLRDAVKTGAMRADLAIGDSGMWGLLHSLLAYNRKNDNERYRLEQDIRRSDEWSGFETAIADAEEQLKTHPSHEQNKQQATAVTRRSRLSATINCPSAARRMETYIQSKGMNQTTFARQAQTTDRTLRSFRQSGKVRRDIFAAIAKVMNITTEEFMKP